MRTLTHHLLLPCLVGVLLTACPATERVDVDIDCNPICLWPYVCDRSQGVCTTDHDQCDEVVTCDCVGVGQTCVGDTIHRCEPDYLSGEDGRCGFECALTPLMECTDGCFAEQYEQPTCVGDHQDCVYDLQPVERELFILEWEDGARWSCDNLIPAQPTLEAHVEGHVVDWWMVLDTSVCGFAIETGDGEWVKIHSCFPCIGMGAAVTLDLRWELQPGNGCVQELVLAQEGLPPRLIKIGDHRVPPGLPYAVELVELDCATLPEGPCGAPTSYGLDITIEGLPTTRVLPSDWPVVYVTDGTRIYELENDVSYFSGACEDGTRIALSIGPHCP